MRGAQALVQGKKGTGADKHQLAFRCPGELHRRLAESAEPGASLTTRVLRGLQDSVELETGAGQRLRELQAQALLENKPFGAMVAELALEALDARKKSKR